MSATPTLLLASTSIYRRELLARLRLAFEVRGAAIDERHLAGESPQARAERLALAKAQAIATIAPECVVIGSDQVASCNGLALDKPGTAEQARRQLRHQSGQTVQFYSAVAVVHRSKGFADTFTDLTEVAIRRLTDAEIDAYVAADQPFDCAGSMRSEGLGVSLCERINTLDPTGLIGLPLIRLCQSLRACGYALP